jgi:hypothetical protein
MHAVQEEVAVSLGCTQHKQHAMAAPGLRWNLSCNLPLSCPGTCSSLYLLASSPAVSLGGAECTSVFMQPLLEGEEHVNSSQGVVFKKMLAIEEEQWRGSRMRAAHAAIQCEARKDPHSSNMPKEHPQQRLP